MKWHDVLKSLVEKNDNKIVLLVADGLGGLPSSPGGKTELETAQTPNMDRLAREGTLGMSIPVKPGITPGSGPGHLGLFGYDPLEFVIGRGALEATGIGFHLQENDVAARGNFCTLDAQGNITDRRAGRIPTSECQRLVEKLRTIRLPEVELFVEPVREHRFVLVLRGPGLGDAVNDTDPQATGVPPLEAQGADPPSRRTAELVNQFVAQARRLLAEEPQANGLTLRGFSARPQLPSYEELYGLRAAALAVYPMYRGLARLVGMELVGQPQTLEEQLELLRENWDRFDFFFIHYKYTDSTGEDGNFEAKVQKIQELDAAVPRIVELGPSVLVITGDHSTPSKLRSHSWHPVPVLLWADSCRTDSCTSFGESEAVRGGLGQIEAQYLMPLALAHAGRLGKYGA